MDLIIVESPTKARTLSKFLGSAYHIEASMGHIRDLPESKMGIDTEKDFEPSYVVSKKQLPRVELLKKLSKEAKTVYFATDPDREGEAIAWHTAMLLNDQISNPKKQNRIAFHEITKSAIEEALKTPREIDMDLVNAQQARRILDRLVGYKLSPLLWRKVRRGLSAGRVQSVAVKLIVEREREIEAFKPIEYWDINVTLDKLTVKLIAEIKTKDQAEKIANELLNTEYRILNTEKKDFKRTPPAPFTTSTLQQTAANKLGWSAKKTMQAAQRLYEQGFITYHRTDSTNVAAEASAQCSVLIAQKFGQEYALETPRLYKTKSKVAQEAHEAIRPTGFNDQTSNPNDQLDRDEQKLYDLIWKRFVACQMAEATGVTVTVTVTVTGGDYKLEARGETINFLGWYKVMGNESTDNILPEVKEGEVLKFVDLEKLQKFTQGPARYNDASLIKTLEELGIGRPSTYAPTIATIEERRYVEKVEKRFKPTAIGIAVNDFLQTHFSQIVDYQFTANMEDELDEIANGKLAWQKPLHDFYDPFAKKLEEVQETAQRVKIETEETGDKCPKCSEGNVIIRTGKFGKFLACSRYPECDYKANFQNKIGMKCPKCTSTGSVSGDVILRRTKSGRNFFGCSNYPKCDFASWTRPSPPIVV